ncbi:MAG TPA: BBE domain-containing protein [Thermomicrobiales bacterium]|nr:BBE domain-containing protein [Thermomicrobiales bacterium]
MHFKPFAVIVACYSGRDLQQGERVVTPLKDLGTVVAPHAGPMPFPALNSAFDAVLPPGLHHYWKSDYVPTLTDEAIGVHATHGPQLPSIQSTMHLCPQTGAIQRVGQRDTAYGRRDVEFVHVIPASDADLARMAGNIAWMHAYYDALRSLSDSGSGGYINFMTDDDGQERIKATYGGDYDRLAQVKTQYDPGNVFRVNQNIRPGR